MAKLLDVPSFAQYSGGLLVSSTFCMLGCLGLQSLLQREMPVQIVWHRERAAVVLLMQCLIVAASCAVVGLLLVATGLSLAGLTSGLLAVAVLHGLSQQVFLIATVESRSRGESLHFARQNLERAGIALAIGCVVGVLLKSAAAVLLAEAIVSFLLTWKTMCRVIERLRIRVLVVTLLAVRRLGEIPWLSAMALLAVMLIGFSFLNADRWLAAQLLRPTAFALYSFAWIFLLVAQSLQSLINTSFFPLLARRFASAGSPAAFGLCARLSIGLLLVCAVVCWPAGRLLNAVILRWFPAYADSTTVIDIFLWVAALRISDFWGSYLIIVGREKRLLLVYLAVGIGVCISWAYMVQPWANDAIAIDDIAWLAVALTVVGYLASFLTAWSERRL
jgi:O-antigen/teichoic acid export membrane protein